MGLKALISVPYSRLVCKKNERWINNPVDAQKNVLKGLLQSGKNTAFGKDHNFSTINNYSDFKKNIPIRDYEGLKTYIERTLSGEKNVLWGGKPLYFCKTSGTTSGTKYIPISKESMPYHLKCAKDAILSYISETGNSDFLNGKTMFIQGSPILENKNNVPLGRLSGIVAHHLPWYLQNDNLPSMETNCVEPWEAKIDAIIEETKNQNMGLISGIPPWVQMYFEKLVAKTGKDISVLYPGFKLFIHGGVNFEPYKQRFKELVGKEIPSIETYPSSEGFIAYQDSQTEKGLLLCVNHGIFFEFVVASTFFDDTPERISLSEVKTGVDYVVILNTNAGLWGYNIGDTVRFVSTNPYRIVVSGRIKHFTSAFGEHVISKEVEEALRETISVEPCVVNEFHVAPQTSPSKGLPHHEWLIEFETPPKNMMGFKALLNKNMCLQNAYYHDLIEGNVLSELKITPLNKNSFVEHMRSVGKLGGQNKTPRLSNDRKIANSLITLSNGY